MGKLYLWWSIAQNKVGCLERVAAEHANHHGDAHALGRLRHVVPLDLRDELDRLDEDGGEPEELNVELVVQEQPRDGPKPHLASRSNDKNETKD